MITCLELNPVAEDLRLPRVQPRVNRAHAEAFALGLP